MVLVVANDDLQILLRRVVVLRARQILRLGELQA